MVATAEILRGQITSALKARTEATLKQIAQAVGASDFPTRVTNELNKMRADALVECAKKPGKNELWYWLATPEQNHGSNTQPAVVKNTGSSASALPSTPAEGAAVHPDPVLATHKECLLVASTADDAATEIPPPQYDPRDVAFPRAFNAAETADIETLRVHVQMGTQIAEIRDAIGDDGTTPLCDLAEAVRFRIAQLEETLRMLRNELALADADLDKISTILADQIDVVLDPVDFCEVELAAKAVENLTQQAETIRLLELKVAEKDDELFSQSALVVDLRARLANETALVEKLEHLLQSARHEADHLRPYAGVDMVNHPPHYQGKVECIDAIESALGPEGFAAYCRGNAIKYTWRAGKKGPAQQDLAKAAWYMARALDSEAPL